MARRHNKACQRQLAGHTAAGIGQKHFAERPGRAVQAVEKRRRREDERAGKADCRRGIGLHVRVGKAGILEAGPISAAV